MAGADLAFSVDPGTVWRVGHRPQPWAWSDWKYATDNGRFNGRFDDFYGQFRTVYGGKSLYACRIEVLAIYRRDAHLADAVEEIEEDPADAVEVPARTPAVLSYD